MAEHTEIEWTDSTWTIVQGCNYESPGCTHCYVPRVLWRLMHNPNPVIAAPLADLVRMHDNGMPVFTGKIALREDRLTWPLKWKKPRRIFVPSHGDLFHEGVPNAFIDRVFAVMALCPQHTFQVLTKRDERMRRYCTNPAIPGRVWAAANDIMDTIHALAANGAAWGGDLPWPLRNVWLGVSVEDQPRADQRIPNLLAAPAAVRFLSCEPLLSTVRLHEIDFGNSHVMDALRGESWQWRAEGVRHDLMRGQNRIDWVICGGESGPGARPMHPDWARGLRDQCVAAGIPFFFKQWGEWAPGECADFSATGPERTATYWEGSWDFSVVTPAESLATHIDDAPDLYRIGKRRSGAFLDGREWKQMPGDPL